jgi:hypothetical protein
MAFDKDPPLHTGQLKSKLNKIKASTHTARYSITIIQLFSLYIIDRQDDDVCTPDNNPLKYTRVDIIACFQVIEVI